MSLGCGPNAAVVRHGSPPILPLPGGVRFAICGDMRTDRAPEPGPPTAAQGMLFAELVARRPDFVLNTGDLVTHGDRPVDWQIFDAWTRGLADAGVPYYPLLGNHEYVGRNDVALPAYFARFPDLSRAKWYTLTAGSLFIVVLDSNLEELSTSERGIQRLYAQKAVASAQSNDAIELIALAFHHPPYTNGPHPPATEVEAELVRPLLGYDKLRLVITGHVHSYERFQRGRVTYLVSGGCGAPPYPVETDAQRIRFAPAYDGPAERGYHFVDCRREATALTCVTEMLVDGSTTSAERAAFVPIDRFSVPIATSTDLPEAPDD